ncbi:MAG: N-acetylmuramoyl-L-alanine amidase [Oscillospiraceae bacterium]|nr:N-acetylmuramoyl-L-alanine amidase [Oscillospiraceae bacterium]
MKMKRNLLLVCSGVLLLVGLLATVFVLVDYTKALPVGDMTVNTTASVAETQTIPAPEIKKAGWMPAERKLRLKSAYVDTDDVIDAAQLKEQGFRSLVIHAPLTDMSPAQLDELGVTLDALKEADLYRVIAVDPADETAFKNALLTLIDTSSFDALMLTDAGTQDAASLLTLAADAVRTCLDGAGLQMPLLVNVAGDILSNKDAAPYAAQVETVLAGFETAELVVSAANAELTDADAWAKYLKKTLPERKIPVSVLLNVQSVAPTGTLEEVVSLFSNLSLNENFGLIFQNPSYQPKSGDAAKLLKQYYMGDLDLKSIGRKLTFRKPFEGSNKTYAITTEEPEITLTGKSSPLFPLTVNGKVVERNDSGDFSIAYLLEVGKNVFRFLHQGETCTITVNHTVKVLGKVRPNTAVETPGDIDFVTTAVARRGASVTATLNGQKITLQPGSAEEGSSDGIHQSDANFITYEGTFHLPKSTNVRQKLGYVQVTASYNGVTDRAYGAKVSITPEESAAQTQPPETPTVTTPKIEEPSVTSTTTAVKTTIPGGTATNGTTKKETTTSTTPKTTTKTTTTAKTTAKPTSKTLLTPNSDNGVGGKSKFVEVTADYANARSNQILDGKSIPSISPLLKGTYDVVTGSSTYDGITYYHTKSGKRLDASDVKVIASGYNLPSNTVRASSSTSSGSLELRFAVDWKIPFNVDLIGQSYQSSNGYSYGVPSLNATGVEIVFYSTGAYAGSVDVNGTSVINGAEWSKNAANETVTLKLALRNRGKYYGYKAVYDGNELVIQFKAKPSASLSGLKIMLDPGHGGSEVGSDLIASHEEFQSEDELNLVIADKIKTRLKALGATVYMTRTSDINMTLGQRTAYLREKNPDLFISVHCDSYSSSSVMGSSAFYYRAASFPLADAIHKQIVKTYKNNIYTTENYGSDAATYQSKVDRGTKFYPFAVTRVEECPAVLIEYGFGSNLVECRVLQKDKYQDLLAQATVDGISDYIKAQ